MASEDHLKIIRQGAAAWNDWRVKNPIAEVDLIAADLNGANLSGANLFEANLSGAELYRANLSGAELRRAKLGEAKLAEANLSGANLTVANLTGAELYRAKLSGAYLSGANLTGANLGEANLFGANLNAANLTGANLRWANLFGAKLTVANLTGAELYRAKLSGAELGRAKLNGANLSGAELYRANLSRADLSGANLSGANLRGAQLIETDLSNATLTESSVYGVSAWNIKVNESTKQQNLIITDSHEPAIRVDNIKVAQFFYLILNNQEIRDVIDTITSKGVLILGRFSEERKPILDAIRDELRKREHDYLPIVFDFQPSAHQTTVETIKTLAGMVRFVIADLTDARSVLQELQAIVPTLPSVAVRLLKKKSEPEYGMLDTIRLYRSVVDGTYEYESVEEVVASIQENIILPAEAKVKELRQRN